MLWLLLGARPDLSGACTTLVAGRLATADGSVMASHSNDGDGATAANLLLVPRAEWQLPAERTVSNGQLPQVARTYAYFTKVGGYASLNEHQVGLAESTCVAVFEGQRGAGAMLDIVDLSALALERANSSRRAVETMGELAERYGYYDAGESLLVVDPTEAFIFHVLPDPSGTSAVWVAQRVPDSHVGVVANSFTVREVDLHDGERFLYSRNMVDVALSQGRWGPGVPFDFTRIFAGPEPGHKYASGRRMWAAFRLLAPAAAERLSPWYSEYVSSAPYPATLPASNVSSRSLRQVMRDYYEGTQFNLASGMAAGAFASPARWSAPSNVSGNWERPIAISRTILSYVLICREWLPAAVGGVLWLAMHAAHTSVYSPFWAGMTTADSPLPEGYTVNAYSRVDRGVGAWQASRFVFNAAQLHFDEAIRQVRQAQELWESRAEALLDRGVAEYVAGNATMAMLANRTNAHAVAAVSAWWALSDDIMLSVAYPSVTYPAWWLDSTDVAFQDGPPPSPEVPPPPTVKIAQV
ncbi:hypothetical protein AB1Y20_005281 [Prymnesium parvum]|uniref:Dipeptidase n=1 Tax=Prymnesium parvum TaxID=97485 RepID=A0AB34J5E4_PRYPA